MGHILPCHKRLPSIGACLLLAYSLPAWSQSPAINNPPSQASVPLAKTAPAQNTSAPSKKDPRVIEDWNSVTLEGSKLYTQPPVKGEKDELPTFTRELLQVGWRPDDGIDLYVVRPKGVTKPPVVLYLYSYPSETKRFRDNDYCERITSGGYAAIGFVSALTGQRYRMRPMKEWFVSELQESLAKSTHDVQMILNLLEKRDDLDLSRVGMFGTGSGATIAILSAAADPRIKAIDLLNPWGDWPDWMEKSFLIPGVERPNYVTADFLKTVAPFDPLVWLPKLKTQRIRVQVLADDRSTPPEAQKKIEAVVPATAQLIKFETGRDFYSAVSGGRVFQWIKAQLKTPAQPPGRNLEQQFSIQNSTREGQPH